MKAWSILGAILLALTGIALIFAVPSAAQISKSPALVRIDAAGTDTVARIIALNIPIYAHLSAANTEYLLAILSPEQQKDVVSLGLALTVLDPDAADTTYYLIENLETQNTAHVASIFTVLHDDGRQAIGKLRPGTTVTQVAALRNHVKALASPIVLAQAATGAIPAAAPYDPLVAALITHVTTETVRTYDGGLSGKWPVEIGGVPYTLATRYTYSGDPIAKATQYVSEFMQARGFDVTYHHYTLSGYNLRNVIGEKRGLVHPDKIVMLTAHLDSRAASWPHDPAPGADDNASGSTALLTAADVLADMDFDYTVRLAFFTGEEQGMWGSYYYALDAYNAGEDIVGVINLDMIAWDAESGPDIDLHSNLPSIENDSDALAGLFASVVDVYGIDLLPQIVKDGAIFSDHSRFWDRGYAAIMGIEDYYNAAEAAAEPRDWNTNYHTVNDRLNTLNLAYFREYVRAGIGTFVHLAGPMRELSGTVTTAATGMLPLPATVTAVAQSGAFSTTASSAGTYALALPAARYTVTASLEGYASQTVTSVEILTGTGARLNFALAPLPAFVVQGEIVDAASGTPLSATLEIVPGKTINAPTGAYSTTLYSGTYLMTARAPFYEPLTRSLVVDGNQHQDFALQPLPCLLVVDDDFDDEGNAYDDQAYYTATLDVLGVSYDVWPVPDDADGPPQDVLDDYRGVVWLTGRDWDFTLTPVDQTALSAYLDGGGRLFVSGQDIGWDIARNGAPPFYSDYLHAAYLRDDSENYELAGADFLHGITITIQGGDGADNQAFPSDIAVTGDGTGVFRYIADGDWAATAYADETYRVVYFAFGFEGIDNAAGRQKVLAYVLDYLQPCAIAPPYALAMAGSAVRVGVPGTTVVHTARITNTGLLSNAYDLALTGATWTSTLSVFSGTALLPITRTPVLAPHARIDLGISVTIPPSAARGDVDGVTLTATATNDPAITAATHHRTIAGTAVYLPLVLRE